MTARELWVRATMAAGPGDVISSIDLIARGIQDERKRCLDIANGWLIAFSETGAKLKFTTPQQFANDAVSDIAELINSGARP